MKKKAVLKTVSSLFIIALFFLILSFLTFPHSSHAYSVGSIQVDNKSDFVLEPGKSELLLNPGETVTKEMYVTDRIAGTTKFNVQVEDFIGSQSEDQPVILLDHDTSPYSIKDSIKPDVQVFSLKFGQKATIPITITIPKNAQPGGYYASVLVSNEPDQINGTSATTQGSTRIISRVGTLFLIRVKGQANDNGHLDDFRIKGQKALFYERGPLTFQILFSNEGNVHLVPYGYVDIQNILGKTIATLPIDAYFSLPNSLRYRDITWNQQFLFGRYTATVHLNRGYSDITDTKSLVFWVLPWKVSLTVLIIIIILAAIVTFILRNFELKKKK